MVADFFINLIRGFFSVCPVISLPTGAAAALTFATSVVGYINVFLPLARLAPIVVFILLVRYFRLVVAAIRFVLMFIPGFGG